jgi:hypothetical protein
MDFGPGHTNEDIAWANVFGGESDTRYLDVIEKI